MKPPVFITGATGSLGRALVARLLKKGRDVTALLRTESSRHSLPPSCRTVVGNPLDGSSYRSSVPEGCIFIHLVGTPHPSPWKAHLFESIDFVSGREAVQVARQAKALHFVYVSVAQPLPFMKAYVNVRQRVEALIQESGISATVLRPLYVLSAKRFWPLFLLPGYTVLKWIQAWRPTLERYEPVSEKIFLSAFTAAIDSEEKGFQTWDVLEMRRQAGL